MQSSLLNPLTVLNQDSVAGHSKLLNGCVCVYYTFVQVTLCANTVKTYRLELVVDVEGVGEEIMSIPINARSDTFPDVNINSSNSLIRPGEVSLVALFCCKLKYNTSSVV